MFFTRWTRTSAPVFVFLAGTSAYLYGRKVGDVRALSRFLLTVAPFSPRDDGDSPVMDLRHHLDHVSTRRRHLDARLVHGADVGSQAASDALGGLIVVIAGADRRERRADACSG